MGVSLLERQASLEAVSRCLERAREGEGSALFVVGEAGLGKTTVLEAAVELAGDDFELGTGRGDPMEAAIPFGLISQALGSLEGERFDLFDDSAGPAVEPSVPFLRTLRGIRSRSGPPLLLILDDLHCADADSISMLGFLVRRIATEPVAIIGAMRPWPPSALEAARGLEAVGCAELQPLDALGDDAASELLDRSAGDAVEEGLADRALSLCAGNPLLIEQLGDVIGRGDGVPATDDRLAASAEHLLLARFAGLDESSMRCARCAAVIGDRFRTDVALEVADLDPEGEETALEALSRSGLIVEVDRGWMRFAHPLFRQALYDDMPAAVRRRLHGRVFEGFASRGLDELAADHAIEADLVGDDGAAEVLERVGRSALAAGAVAGAAANLESAVRFRGSRCDADLLLTLAKTLSALARVEDATAVCRRLLAIEGLKWTDRAMALRVLGKASYLTGSVDLGDEQIGEAVELAVANEPKQAIRPLLDHASITWMASGPAAALPKAERARELAVDAEPDLRDAADALWGHLAAECGEPSGIDAVEAIGLRLDGGNLGNLLSPAELTWPAAGIYGYSHCEKYAERFDRALAALNLARDALEHAGAANGIATVTLFIGNQLVRQGYPEPALAEAGRAEEFSELTPIALPFASLIRADALLRLGRFEESERHRLAAIGQAPDPGLWLIGLWSRLILATRLLRQGDLRASGEFIGIERLTDSIGLREPSDQPWAGYAVQAHLAAGRRDDAVRVTGLLEQRADGHPSRWPRSIAALSRARLLEHDGEQDAAEAAFVAAIELLDGVDLPLERADALLARGRFNRRLGRTVDARAPLAEALALAESVGASHLAGLAHSELKLAGGRRRRAVEDRDLITAAEMRVAREAAGGLTNAEIARRLHISTNTVQTHLKRVYAKLGINSRRELTEADLEANAGSP